MARTPAASRAPARPPPTSTSTSTGRPASPRPPARACRRSPRRPAGGRRDRPPAAGRASAAGQAADLVAEHQPAHAGAQQHGGLLQVGDRRAPGAGVEQALHDLRRHGRLGMRRQRGAVAMDVAEDLVGVVGEGGFVQRQHRQGHVAIARPPAATGHVAQRDGACRAARLGNCRPGVSSRDSRKGFMRPPKGGVARGNSDLVTLSSDGRQSNGNVVKSRIGAIP